MFGRTTQSVEDLNVIFDNIESEVKLTVGRGKKDMQALLFAKARPAVWGVQSHLTLFQRECEQRYEVLTGLAVDVNVISCHKTQASARRRSLARLS